MVVVAVLLWVDCGYMHHLEVRRIARVKRREQWDKHIRNDNIKKSLKVLSVKEAARVTVCVGLSMCKGYKIIGYRRGFCLKMFRVLGLAAKEEIHIFN